MLNDYVDGTIDMAICEEFEKHMAGCNPCQVVVDNIRKTITIYRQGEPYELPVKFRERLHEALRKRWKETRSTAEPSTQHVRPVVSDRTVPPPKE